MPEVVSLAFHDDALEPASAKLHERLGISQVCAAYWLAQDLSRATQPGNEIVQADPSFSPAVMLVEDMRPQNAAQAMIAAQLSALTPLMLAAVGEANQADTAQGRVLWTNEAVKLARTSAQLADTFGRLQRGGEQRVIIERVDVRDGGQAIVGAVQQSSARRGVQPILGSTP